jgi:O-antigen/teichoic acid export membrane protein
MHDSLPLGPDIGPDGNDFRAPGDPILIRLIDPVGGPATEAPASNLRDQALRGGAFMLGRQVLSIGIGVLGLIALTRLIGPVDYGYYAGFLAVVTVLAEVAALGVRVYLIKLSPDTGLDPFRQSFAFLLVSGTLVVCITAAVVGLLGDQIVPPEQRPALLTMLLTIIFTLLGVPSFGLLERDLNYRAVAIVEFVNDVFFYVVALPLAFLGFGLWAPVIGYVVAQASFFVRATVASGLRPSFVWSPALARDLLRFGVPYSGAQLGVYGRGLVNPLVIGPLLGPAAVGIVALTIRAADVLTFVSQVTSRLSIAIFSRIRAEAGSLTAAHEEATMLQMLAAGAPLAAFAVTAPWIMPAVLGASWAPVSDVFPLVGFAYFTTASFNMSISALYVLGRNALVASTQLLNLGILAVATAVAAPRLGETGYAVGAAIGLLAYAYLAWRMRGVLEIRYRRLSPAFVAWSLAIIAILLPRPEGLLLALTPLLLLFDSRQRQRLREYFGYLRPLLARRRVSSARH